MEDKKIWFCSPHASFRLNLEDDVTVNDSGKLTTVKPGLSIEFTNHLVQVSEETAEKMRKTPFFNFRYFEGADASKMTTKPLRDVVHFGVKGIQNGITTGSPEDEAKNEKESIPL